MSELASDIVAAAIDYKRRVSANYELVESKGIASKLAGKSFAVTRKIDGIMTLVVYRDGQVYIVGSGGRDLSAVPVGMDIKRALETAGVKSAIIAAELYRPSENGRPRCYDVAKALADEKLIGELRLAPYDWVEENGEKVCFADYCDTHAKLTSVFKEDRVRPVELRKAESISAVESIFEDWVNGEGAEGLVVHSEGDLVWKIKPRHTIDAVAVGYTTGDEGMRDLLMAVRDEEGRFQVFGVCANGFSDEDRRSLVKKLEGMAVPSKFVRTDSRGVAFRMIKPELVLEISAGEFRSEDISGRPKYNPILEFGETGWKPVGMVPGVATYGMIFVRFRDDKSGDPVSVRVSQIRDLCGFADAPSSSADLPKSTIIERKVFKKTVGAKVMVQKFVAWKTNKESDPRYPAYVVYYTDFSSGRKEPLKRDIRISRDAEGARRILTSFLAENVKKGWYQV